MYGLTIYIAGLLLNAILSTAVAIVAFRARNKPGGLSLGLLMSAVALWSLGLVGEFSVTTIPAKILWSKIQYPGAMSSPVFLLMFTLEFANQERWLKRRHLILYWVIPVITVALAWTNEWHHWIWTSFTPSPVTGSADWSNPNAVIYGHGPWFWVMVGYAYLILTTATFLFLRAALQRRYLYRRQAVILLAAIFPPWLVNMLYVFDLGPVPGWDLTSFGFALTGILLMWSLTQWNLLDLVPIAHGQVIESMHDGILILDGQNRIIGINPAAQRMLGVVPSPIGQPAGEAVALCLDSITHDTDEPTEVHLDGNPPRHLSVLTSPISDQKGRVVGRLIVCRDITEHKQAQTEIWEQQRALAVMKEGQRVSRELHSSVRQVLAYIIEKAQTTLDLIEEDQAATAATYLAHLINAARDASTDIDRFVLSVRATSACPELVEGSGPGFFEALQQYVRQFSQTHELLVTLSQPDEPADDLLTPIAQIQLLRIIQEALFNISQRAQAHTAQVVITRAGEHVQVLITDDSGGPDPQTTGDADEQTGLATMRQRAAAVGGTLDVRSTPGQGPHIIVHLPRREPPEETSLPQMRVLLVDDHQILLEGFKDLLEHHGVNVVGMAKDGYEAIEQTRDLRPDIVLMDVKMPGMSGIEATRRIKEEIPDTKVVMLTVSQEEEDLFEAFRSGASSYLLKSMDPDQFFSLLSKVMQGEAPLAPDMVGHLIASITQSDTVTKTGGLSLRQISILRLVAHGLTYKEIGVQLHISESTVRYHMGQIREQLGVSSRAEVVAYAVHIGLLEEI
jgi:DNA-binding NarL/FixJ family response regulator/signal transduction histidine kinase